MNGADPIVVFAIIAVLLFSYLLPMFVAMIRGHRNTVAIALTNILLGWTFLGWVIALVWSFTNDGATYAVRTVNHGGQK